MRENDIKLLKGDCLRLMRDIPDHSVDMILCDLPYGVLNKANINAQWDTRLPLKDLWEQYERVVKENGAIVLFSQGLFTAQLILSNPKLYRYNLVWNKCRATGFLNANRMPLRYHEDIAVFYKKLPLYNPQMEDLNGRERSHPQGNGKHAEKNHCYGDVSRISPRTYDKKFPGSIISIPREHDGKQIHPTQKPVALLEYLIKTFTNEGDLVMDNTFGSGSTAVACVNTERKFLGMEIDDDYFNAARERVMECIHGKEAKEI